MSYTPFSEPSATFTASNYVVYTKKISMVSGSYYPIFTTENGLGHFCVTDIYAHLEPSTPAWSGLEAWRISVGTNVGTYPGNSYNNIANETGAHSAVENKAYEITKLATRTVKGAGTTVNSNTTVYARTLQMTTAATTNSGTIIIGGFYSRLPEP